MVYYTWYNNHPQKDIRFNFIVKSGEADMYISTYDDKDGNLTLADRLPKSKRDPWTYWVSEGNRPTSNV